MMDLARDAEEAADDLPPRSSNGRFGFGNERQPHFKGVVLISDASKMSRGHPETHLATY